MLARRVRLVRLVPRAHKASKDPWGPRALSGSGDQLALRARPDRSDRRVRRAKPVAKAQSAPPAIADRPARRAPLARPARQDRQAQRATLGRLRQFAWSPVPTAFAAETTKSWLVSFARAARPTERNARRLAQQQRVYVYGGDLIGAARNFGCSAKLAPVVLRYGQVRRVRAGAAEAEPSSKIVGGNPRPSLLSSLRPVFCAHKSGLPSSSFCVFVHCQCAICDLKFTMGFAAKPDTIKQADIDCFSL
jgi:hypothetical protein